MIRQTTQIDTVIHMQRLCQKALDHQTFVNQCLDRLDELNDQVLRSHGKTVEMNKALALVLDKIGEVEEAVSNVYFQSLEGALNDLRYAAEKAAKDGGS